MNSLKVPEQGLRLESNAGNESALPSQAFAITLSDNVIEDMIKCVQEGSGIQLALGSTPTLLYGSSSHQIERSPDDSYPYDLYLTKPFESTRKAERIPYAGSLFSKPKISSVAAETRTGKAENHGAKSSQSSKGSVSSGLDSDLEALQNGLAAHDKARERARIADKAPAGKKSAAKAKGKLLPGYVSGARSITTSPALNAVRSPPDTPTMSASQQAMERKKEQRFILVHELAVKDRSIEYLQEKWEGVREELQPTLEKVADYKPEKKEWAMKKTYWKELDVWNYDYEKQEERQKAIDNAIPHYDKQRLSSSEPEWERLLPKKDRGKGICLSRLQAGFAKGLTQAAPKIKVQKADDSPVSKDDGDVLKLDKPSGGGEAMARSSSNPLPAKSKKPNSNEAQVKRLLGKSTKPAAAPKASPTKAKPTSIKASGTRVLSQAIITNSDSSGDEAPVAPQKPKPVSRPAAKPSPKPRDTVVVKPRPPIREPMKQQPAKQQPPKRPREEDDDSSSSSGTPLSKRVRDKQPLVAAAMKQRISEAKLGSRGPGTNTHKAKATSPTKSSPLASSPPTNASDLESDAPPIMTKKRKAEVDIKPSATKRPAARNVSAEVMSLSYKFKRHYATYEALHYEISALDNPPEEKVDRLLDMRIQLQGMKDEIYQKQSASDRD
ncbi:hypothetical protein S7711_08662 [Stachybotrys chartarum IBT 7711]|uniref:Uncharacterized protein n=1 Tax=Stachybotrys chartarum (strain CBS 109288 / IBT 7711) TaxID=1280523 RepID=A0A084AYT7_STACB|nr:hypothetical protein S7711_08662 [Stachybotrys chartarum IBT 7711]KFA73111.1 hypothetical protein S40288_02758 [Stachybotrys chartarum IBT 40288]